MTTVPLAAQAYPTRHPLTRDLRSRHSECSLGRANNVWNLGLGGGPMIERETHLQLARSRVGTYAQCMADQQEWSMERSESELSMQAKIERELVHSPEAEALQRKICDAVLDYSHLLESRGLIWDEENGDYGGLKAQALVITLDFGDGNQAVTITLSGGALDPFRGSDASVAYAPILRRT